MTEQFKHDIIKPQIGSVDDLLSDYRAAEITVIYNRNLDTKERVLVFAIIELIPQFIEAGPDFIAPISTKLGKSRNEINVHRFHLPPSKAVDWYLSCRTGKAILSVVVKEQAKDLILTLGQLDEEPIWPNLINDNLSDYPFWGYRPGQSRIHQLMPIGENIVAKILGDPEAAKAHEWLGKNFPIDIMNRPKLWGSVHLLAPNPLIRDLSLRLSESDSRLLCIHTDIYPGATIDDIELVFREYRPRGIGLNIRIALKTPYTAVELPYAPHSMSLELVCKRRGVLYSIPSCAFPRRFSMGVQLTVHQRRVHVPARTKTRGAEIYEVPMSSRQEFSGGTPWAPSALEAVAEDIKDLQTSASSVSMVQRWFDGDQEEATRFIRELIGAANKDVYIVDPYFGAIELRRFALANATNGVKVRILTSAEFLRKPLEQDSARTCGHELAQDLEHILQVTRRNDIEIRVGLGARSPIHDRFLLIDGCAWIIGSSLNEFGARGTIAIRAHHHEEIIKVLEEVWHTIEKCPVLQNFISVDPS